MAARRSLAGRIVDWYASDGFSHKVLFQLAYAAADDGSWSAETHWMNLQKGLENIAHKKK